MIRDPEAAYGTAIRKREAVHLAFTSKVEVIWATGIRKAKAANAVQASKLQWQHQEAMQNLEEEALKVEKDANQSLSSGLWSGPPSLPEWYSSKTDVSLPSVNGKSIPPWTSDSNFNLEHKVEESCYLPHHPSRPWCPLPGLNNANLQSRKLKQIILGSQPYNSRERKIPWWAIWGIPTMRPSVRIWNWFNTLGQTYFRTHALTFHKEVTNKQTEVFKELAEMAGFLRHWGLPCSQPVGGGEKNFAPPTTCLGGPPKTSIFSEKWLPLNPPKMGLWVTHSPKALKQQVGCSFCPWCRKEGQNKGTILNHLCTGHYHLGLVSKRCLSYFTTT